jgi:Ca2+/Na+ antiporter
VVVIHHTRAMADCFAVYARVSFGSPSLYRNRRRDCRQTCEHHLCVALSQIAKTLKMSSDVAGVTILAFGNGAADVFSVLAAINQSESPLELRTLSIATRMRADKFDIALNEATGSGAFVVMCVVAAVGFVSFAKLTRFSFIRDVMFYFGALLFVFFATFDGEFSLAESGGLMAYYVAYVIIVMLSGRVRRMMAQRREKKAASAGDNAHTDAQGESVRDDTALVALSAHVQSRPLFDAASVSGAIGATVEAAERQRYVCVGVEWRGGVCAFVLIVLVGEASYLKQCIPADVNCRPTLFRTLLYLETSSKCGNSCACATPGRRPLPARARLCRAE